MNRFGTLAVKACVFQLAFATILVCGCSSSEPTVSGSPDEVADFLANNPEYVKQMEAEEAAQAADNGDDF